MLNHSIHSRSSPVKPALGIFLTNLAAQPYVVFSNIILIHYCSNTIKLITFKLIFGYLPFTASAVAVCQCTWLFQPLMDASVREIKVFLCHHQQWNSPVSQSHQLSAGEGSSVNQITWHTFIHFVFILPFQTKTWIPNIWLSVDSTQVLFSFLRTAVWRFGMYCQWHKSSTSLTCFTDLPPTPAVKQKKCNWLGEVL